MGKWKTVYKTTGEATVRQFGKEHTIPATSVVQTRTRFTGSKVIKDLDLTKQINNMKKILTILAVALLLVSCNADTQDRVDALKEIFPESIIIIDDNGYFPIVIDTSLVEARYFIPSYFWVSDVKPRDLVRLREYEAL